MEELNFVHFGNDLYIISLINVLYVISLFCLKTLQSIIQPKMVHMKRVGVALSISEGSQIILQNVKVCIIQPKKEWI